VRGYFWGSSKIGVIIKAMDMKDKITDGSRRRREERLEIQMKEERRRAESLENNARKG